jgi:hypothetical protein
MEARFFDGSFPHRWQAEILPNRPLILPARHYTYPRDAEEVERGALEVLIRPVPDLNAESNPNRSPSAQEFLATCALGFRDPVVPTGLWSTPNPNEICAISGGYAYIIDTQSPERFTLIHYRPILEIRPLLAQELLLFVSHHSILAWGRKGCVWESKRLSSEGITITSIDDSALRGLGWDMLTDKEIDFALDVHTGLRIA